MPSGGPRFRLALPSAPLLRFIEGRGGLAAVLGNSGIETYDPERGEQGRVSKEYEAIERKLRRGEENGYLTFWWVDEFCCEHLRLHPFEVYGEDYFYPSKLGELAANAQAEAAVPAAA